MLSLHDLLMFARADQMPSEKRRGMVREYLQTLVLFYLQQTDLASKLVFIGGTALRFFYRLQRFSEDLDFNVLGVVRKENLHVMLDHLKTALEKEKIPLQFSIRKSHETYVHWKVYLQFPEILQYYQCAGRKGQGLHPAELLSLQLDFQNLGKKTYPVVPKVIAYFGKRFLFNTTELSMFLAEKSNAVLFRKPPRARDFFDLMSLLQLGAPIDLKSLRRREIPVKTRDAYIKLISDRVARLDFKKLTEQLAPFLFRHEDIEIMKRFPQVIETLLTSAPAPRSQEDQGRFSKQLRLQ